MVIRPLRLCLVVLILGAALLGQRADSGGGTQPPVTVSFKSKTYSVSEKVGDAEIEVIREGDPNPEVSVTFQTSAGTATAGKDYEEKTATVTFATGVTSQKVKVKILYTNTPDPNRTVNLTLKDPTACALKDPYTATLIILDEDAPKKPVISNVDSPNSLNEGDTATVKVTIQHPTLNETMTVKIEWGDGVSPAEERTVTNATGITDVTFTHLYVDDNPTGTPQDDNKVKITVTDSKSNTDSKEVTITVMNVAPTVTVLTVSPPDAGNKVTVHGEFTDPGATDTFSLQVVWGDASAPQTVDLKKARTFDLTHVFMGGVPVDGYLIVFTLTDDDTGQTKEQRRARRVQIRADVNRDGNLDGTDDSETLKLNSGTVVIADKEGVYADTGLQVGGTQYIPAEKALRREIKFLGADVVAKRSSARVRLFDAATAGTEQAFDGNSEVKLKKDTSYWLQGGTDPSPGVRQDWLKVKEDAGGGTYAAGDQLNITVLWVNISTRITGPRTGKPLFDGYDTVTTRFGQPNLGVQRSAAGSTEGTKAAFAAIEIQGSILPKDFSLPGVTFPVGFVAGTAPDKTNVNGTPTKATLGFVFRRYRNFKGYINGMTAADEIKSYDDSVRLFQDVTPDTDPDSNLLIIDFDGPGGALFPLFVYAQQQRNNFWEHIVFYWGNSTKPERVTKRIVWASTIDFMLDFNLKAVFLYDAPNGIGARNKLLGDTQLASLDVAFPNAPNMTVANNAAGNKDLKNKTTIDIIIDGTDLIGQVTLRKAGKDPMEPLGAFAQADPGDPRRSLLTKIKITIPIDGTVGDVWDLVIENPKGKSTIGGFKIVN